MSQRCFAAAGALFQPSTTLLGEIAVAREMPFRMGLADVPEFLPGHIGLVKGNPHFDTHSITRCV